MKTATEAPATPESTDAAPVPDTSPEALLDRARRENRVVANVMGACSSCANRVMLDATDNLPVCALDTPAPCNLPILVRVVKHGKLSDGQLARYDKAYVYAHIRDTQVIPGEVQWRKDTGAKGD